jgi:hypothetical protein
MFLKLSNLMLKHNSNVTRTVYITTSNTTGDKKKTLHTLHKNAFFNKPYSCSIHWYHKLCLNLQMFRHFHFLNEDIW